MNRVAGGIQLIKLARKQQRAVQTGVKSALLLVGAAADFGAGQGFIPGIAAFLLHGFEVIGADFLEVALGLLQADER